MPKSTENKNVSVTQRTYANILAKIPVYCRRNPNLNKKVTYDMIIDDALRGYN